MSGKMENSDRVIFGEQHTTCFMGINSNFDQHRGGNVTRTINRNVSAKWKSMFRTYLHFIPDNLSTIRFLQTATYRRLSSTTASYCAILSMDIFKMNAEAVCCFQWHFYHHFPQRTTNSFDRSCKASNVIPSVAVVENIKIGRIASHVMSDHHPTQKFLRPLSIRRHDYPFWLVVTILLLEGTIFQVTMKLLLFCRDNERLL